MELKPIPRLPCRFKVSISHIKFIVLEPEQASGKKFKNLVKNEIDWQPFEQEDIQAMGFYACVKSKMQGRDMCELWLELTQGRFADLN